MKYLTLISVFPTCLVLFLEKQHITAMMVTNTTASISVAVTSVTKINMILLYTWLSCC